MTYRIVFTDHDLEDLPTVRAVFDGMDVELVEGDREADRDEMAALVEEADGIIAGYRTIDADMMDGMPDCQVISRAGIGFDTVDLEAATERDIYVTNVPDYCIPEVSDHAMALLLALQRNIVTYDRQVRDGGWDVFDARPMRRLSTLTLGLVAFGDIARSVASKAAAFGMDVLAFDPYLDPEDIRAGGAEPVADLHEMLSHCDAVSVHAPLTEGTRGLLDRAAFRQLPEGAVVVNTARGPVIDEADLVAALDADDVAAAGLDVLEEEPPGPDDPLLERDDVILSPHAAWNSRESRIELLEKSARRVRQALEGEVPESVVNPDVLD